MFIKETFFAALMKDTTVIKQKLDKLCNLQRPVPRFRENPKA